MSRPLTGDLCARGNHASSRNTARQYPELNIFSGKYFLSKPRYFWAATLRLTGDACVCPPCEDLLSRREHQSSPLDFNNRINRFLTQ